MFNAVVLVLLGVDLGLARRKGGHAPVTTKSAAVWTAVWVALSLGFAAAIWVLGENGTWPWGGKQHALEFVTAYLVEYALSVDNLFVFLMVFAFYKVKPEVQHTLLFWGVLSAFVMRAALILAGSALVHRFHWMMYLFGAFLLYTAAKMVLSGGDDEEVHPSDNRLFKFARRVLPMAEGDHGHAFFVREGGKLKVTLLLPILLVVETTDLLFAVDSIPAVVGLSDNPFIIYSSNICAVLGLRSLFFLVAALMGRFHYLQVGLSAVLAFVGLKMLTSSFVQVPVGLSLGIIAGILGVSIGVSVLRPPKEEKADGEAR
ncbi:MAG: TerC/Alx family metal homeostasis membrane protein [Deltaproteobacteria bacterium]|nr:TerC/Alx family metal homeostasis membrane protein [Deltaproteobacteria bacterium]